MEANELTIQLEQRTWERLQKLSERNREPMESLVARILDAEMAKTFNKPPDIVISPEARRIRDSFIAGRTQVKPFKENVPTPAEVQANGFQPVGKSSQSLL